MAFKSDWTPGILRYIVPVVIILIIALGLSMLFDEYPSWVGILVFIALVSFGIIGLAYIFRTHNKKTK